MNYRKSGITVDWSSVDLGCYCYRTHLDDVYVIDDVSSGLFVFARGDRIEQYDKRFQAIVMEIVGEDYDLYSGYSDAEIVRDGLELTPCSSCPYFDECDAAINALREEEIKIEEQKKWVW